MRAIHQSGQSLAALPLFVSATQINAVLPSAMPVGLATITVSYNGQTSNPETVRVVRSSLGIFTRNSAGTGTAIVQNYVSATELPLNSPATPAVPGQLVILWGTGLGPIATPDGEAPSPAPRIDPMEVTVAGRAAAVDYQGRSGCCAGVDQINFRIPTDAPVGCSVPLLVKLHSGVISNLTSIAISADGGPCSDGQNLSGRARRWGEVNLLPDSATAQFAETEPPARYPVPGACSSNPGPGIGGRPLNAGASLTLNGNIQVPADGSGYARRNLSLAPGALAVEGAGGPEVGSFRATLSVAAGFAWTSQAGSRSAGLTVGWAGPADYVVVSGPAFVCTAAASPGSFTVPPEALANLPAQFPLQVAGVTQASFTASGLDAGVIRYHAATVRNVSLGEALLPATPVRLPDGRFILAELALTGPEQQRGLMQRTELPAGRGMLFLFDRPQTLGFWMFGTLIPLDIIWMDSARRIVFLSANTPPCRSVDPAGCPVYGPSGPAQYVLEIGGGEAARLGLRLGDRLDW